MSTIGSGPNIGTGPQFDSNAARGAAQTNSASTQGALAETATTPATTTQASTTQAATAQAAATTTAQTGSAAQSMVSSSTSAGAAPVDTDRTAAIKSAIKNGTYPILPTKIGDAMIAASLILRSAA